MDNDRIKEIAQKRAELEMMGERCAEAAGVLRTATEKLPEFRASLDLSSERTVLGEILGSLEAQYRVDCTLEFQKSEEKQYPGLTVRETTRYEYDDKEALLWAFVEQNELLNYSVRLDKKAFKHVAASALCPDFVTVVKGTDTRLSSDLSEFLEEEGKGEENDNPAQGEDSPAF